MFQIKENVGGAKGDRTPDLYAASVALSQLSYGPTISVSIITFFPNYTNSLILEINIFE